MENNLTVLNRKDAKALMPAMFIMLVKLRGNIRARESYSSAVSQ